MSEKITGILRRKRFWFAIVIIVAALIVIFVWKPWVKGVSTTSYTLTTVKKGDLSITVSGSGQVSALKSVGITPEASGKVVSVKAANGQMIKTGDVIAVLDQRDALLDLARANASLLSAQANYDEIVSGVTGDDLRLYQLSLDSTQATYDSAVKDLETVKRTTQESIDQAQEKLDDLTDESTTSVNNERAQLAVTLEAKILSAKNSLDKINRLLENDDAKSSLSVLDSSYLTLAKSNYESAKNNLPIAEKAMEDVQILRNDTNLQNGVNSVINLLNGAVAAANNLFSALEKSSPSSDFSQSSIDSNKSSMNSEASTMTTAITTIQTDWQELKDDIKEAENELEDAKLSAEQSIESAQAKIDSALRSLEIAKVQYQKNISPATEDEIASAKASLLSAQASVRSAQTTYENTVIKASLDGKIDGFETVVGDQVSQSSIGTIITDQKIAVIPFNEVDVAKIKVGQEAVMTFDAIDDLSIKGKVVEVSSTGSVSQGIVNYDVKISLDEIDERIKTEMSVSAVITVETKTDILLVPSEAVKSQGDSYYVEIPTEEKSEEDITSGENGFDNFMPKTASSVSFTIASSTLAGIPKDAEKMQRNEIYIGGVSRKVVTIGISDETYMEITSGLSEGDSVVQKTINSAGASSSGNSGNGNSSSLMMMRGSFTGTGGGPGGGGMPTR